MGGGEDSAQEGRERRVRWPGGERVEIFEIAFAYYGNESCGSILGWVSSAERELGDRTTHGIL